MASVRISPEADRDIQDIHDYILRDDPDAASRVIQSFLERFSMLTRQPMIGTPRDDLLPGLRDFTVGRYVIFHRVLPGEGPVVEIVRVLHVARDVRQIF